MDKNSSMRGTSMRAIPGLSEAQVVEIIYKVIDLLAKKFRFGYFDIEDMRQEGMLFALRVLEKDKYDASRPLENFLYHHLRNRFINYKRDKFLRNETPCKRCIFFDPKFKKSTNACAAFEDKLECPKLKDWRLRNAAKQSLMQPTGESDSPEPSAPCRSQTDEVSDLKLYINENLPMDVRTDYLRMIEGLTLPKSRRDRVREAVLEVYKDYQHEQQEDV
jgi:DNA-directed RNA polymerase specialized sigma24 family protein